MEITAKETEEAKSFLDFYINLVESHKERAIFYVSENAVLDWFGQTVKGEKNINAFIKSTVSTVVHQFTNIKPVPKIGFRESHVIQLPQNKKTVECDMVVPCITQVGENCEKTPPNCRQAPRQGLFNIKEKGQGDGFHVDQNECHSPAKKCRIDGGHGDFDIPSPVKFVSAEGFIEFHKSSSKKLQAETKWKRPCKLEIAYSVDPIDKYTIHLIIYDGNMKCRKNLLKDFEACQSKDDT